LGTLANLGSLYAGISQAEGYGLDNALPTQANNPGDLELGDIGYGTVGNNITVYPDYTTGQNALVGFLNNIFSGNNPNDSPSMSIQQFADTYVNGPQGGTTQGSQNWAQTVAQSLNAGVDTPIGEAVGSAQNPDAADQYSLGVSGYGGFGAPSPTTGVPSVGQFSGSPGQASGRTLSDYVSIGMGLLLLGAGLFMFRQTQVLIQGAGSVGRAAARVAAA
jgi:hypothetical protein